MLTKSISPICEIAHGGMGYVVLGVRREGSFQRLYAVKRLHPHLRRDPGVRSMFLDEARLSGLIRHPNVVSVLDVGEDEEGSFLVMDFVDGVPVATILEETFAAGRTLPLQFCLSVCLDAARGLHAAHELLGTDGKPLGLVHRDVSPQNILVGFDGIVRMTDFGIAKAFGNAKKTSLGVLKGSGGYMSPEQLRFEEPDRRSDLFSLGVVLYELLSGQPLYSSSPGPEAARRILGEAVPDIGDARDDVPVELVELLFRLIAKDPDRRPATAAEVAAALEGILVNLLRDEARLDVSAYLGRHFGHLRISQRAEVIQALNDRNAAAITPVPTPEPAPPPAAVTSPSERPARRWTGRRIGVVAVAALGVTGLVAAVALRGERPVPEPRSERRARAGAILSDAGVAPAAHSMDVWAGAWHSCANRAGVLYCWGKNNEGQLGNGTTWDSTIPVQVRPGLRNVVQVDGGHFHTCARLSDGRVLCFGRNREGQLGTGSRRDALEATAVVGDARFVDMDAGDLHTCGVDDGGRVLCWGENAAGQLGDGTTSGRTGPAPVPGIEGARQVSAGGMSTCALAKGGVYCWGNPFDPQAGIGVTGDLPTLLAGLTDAAEVRVGSRFACARKTTGKIACWGHNEFGELGDGAVAGRIAPAEIASEETFVQLATGNSCACARQQSGKLYCWGRNDWGNLGNGTNDGTRVPVPVVGLFDAISVAMGSVHTCARGRTGAVGCWGHNDTGQIGDGTRGKNRRSPVAVAGLD